MRQSTPLVLTLVLIMAGPSFSAAYENRQTRPTWEKQTLSKPELEVPELRDPAWDKQPILDKADLEDPEREEMKDSMRQFMEERDIGELLKVLAETTREPVVDE